LPHPRPVFAGSLLPRAAAFHQFRPEGENPALGRLRRMYSAAFAIKKVAACVAGNTQADAFPRAENVLAFESVRLHAQKRRRTHDIVLREIDEAPLPATFRTAGLAGKSQSFGHCRIILCHWVDIYDILPTS